MEIFLTLKAASKGLKFILLLDGLLFSILFFYIEFKFDQFIYFDTKCNKIKNKFYLNRNEDKYQRK